MKWPGHGGRPVLPAAAEVVVVGGGIAGVSTAYYLAQAGVPVALCEKGRIAGEQSSRNWGWIRKQGRDFRELELTIESLRRWPEIVRGLDEDVGFTVGGVTYLAESEDDLGRYETWLAGAKEFQLDSRMLSVAEADAMLGQARRRFLGGIHTPSDARAEPARAVPAIAWAARRMGAVILEGTAVRTVERAAGRVSGVVTEHGRIACPAVVLAGGIWSRPFLRNLGLRFPQLAVRASAQRTTAAPLVSQSAFGAAGASIRRRADGGYTVGRTGVSRFDLVPAAFTHFRAFAPLLREKWRDVGIRFGRPFFEALARRRWAPDEASPFEAVRVMDPEPDPRLLDDVMRAARDLYPQLAGARPVERWAGMIDVTPDELPVLGPVDAVDGLYVATGFSGHGFGIGPGAGYVTARMVRGEAPQVDVAPLRFDRSSRPGGGAKKSAL